MRAGTNRILELDGLRGVAIALVILFHVELLFPVRSARLASAMLFGWSGVDLFFVLSGFLIGGILLDHRDTDTYFSAFYARRFFRIVPVYFGVVALFALAWMVGGDVRDTVLHDLGQPMPWYTYLSFTNNVWIGVHDTMRIFLPVSWSLAVEEQFYLTLPLVVRFVPRRRLFLLVSGAALVVLCARAWACWNGVVTQDQAYVLPWFRADALLIGVLCALLVRNREVAGWLERRRWVLFTAMAALGAAVIAAGTSLPPENATPRTPLMTLGLTLVAMFYATVLLAAVLRPARALSAVLTLPPLRFLGKVSYCVYLAHEGIMTVFAWEIWPLIKAHVPASFAYLVMAAAVLSILGVAQLSWMLLESKMQRIGHQFKYRYGKPILSPVVTTATAEEPAA